MTLKASLAVATAGFAILAAALWWFASYVSVSTEKAEKLRQEKLARTGKPTYVALAFDEKADLEHTLAAQSYWNRRAAAAAGMAAIFQAAYVSISEFGQ